MRSATPNISRDDRGGAWLKTGTYMDAALERLDDPLVEWAWWRLRMYLAKAGLRGVVPYSDLHVAVQRKVTLNKARSLVEALVAAELVADTGVGWELPRWIEENPDAETWHDDVKRERWARDKRLKRDSELCRRIKERDRNLCRYCGIRVDWNDKVGAKGGTYDHVDPDGGNEFANVVVSCRRCNGRKKDRTPEQAGMTLWKPGTLAKEVEAASRGPTPGQPRANRGSAGSLRARARPDRVNPGLTPGQPEPSPNGSGHDRAPTPVPSTDDLTPPPHTDVDAPRGTG